MAGKEIAQASQASQVSQVSQVSRALALGAYFFSGCLAINITQVLGVPLYLINKDWYSAWVAFTKQSFGLLTIIITQYWAPTAVKVSGDASVRGQLIETVDGNLLCNFSQRAVLIANHQIYTDWLYLWWIAYSTGMHGRVYIILKESLRRIPVVGWGMQLSRFIFLKRNWEEDKPRLAAHMHKLRAGTDPMWLMMFPEGTNLASCTREASRKWAERNKIKDLQHTLLPRSTGLHFCLNKLGPAVPWVYDCTIAYEGVPRGQYAQDIFTLKAAYGQGKPPKTVHMYWRRFHVSTLPLGDHKAFEVWLRARWIEKDHLIEHFYTHGHFPADRGVDRTPDGRVRRGAGHINTTIKALHWWEFLQVLAPMSLLGLVLFAFYDALPRAFMNLLNRLDLQKKVDVLKQYRLVTDSPQKILSDPRVARQVRKMAASKAVSLSKDRQEGGGGAAAAASDEHNPASASSSSKALAVYKPANAGKASDVATVVSLPTTLSSMPRHRQAPSVITLPSSVSSQISPSKPSRQQQQQQQQQQQRVVPKLAGQTRLINSPAKQPILKLPAAASNTKVVAAKKPAATAPKIPKALPPPLSSPPPQQQQQQSKLAAPKQTAKQSTGIESTAVASKAAQTQKKVLTKASQAAPASPGNVKKSAKPPVKTNVVASPSVKPEAAARAPVAKRANLPTKSTMPVKNASGLPVTKPAAPKAKSAPATTSKKTS